MRTVILTGLIILSDSIIQASGIPTGINFGNSSLIMISFITIMAIIMDIFEFFKKISE
jgi:hypothetical protein